VRAACEHARRPFSTLGGLLSRSARRGALSCLENVEPEADERRLHTKRLLKETLSQCFQQSRSTESLGAARGLELS
jgi:hypothetical protein